ncbi:hypothetical protein Mapa_007263 [Marchantia paleacea]|nr:hypothetical protein Mapa_007263 [Marchantia paleacea]
MTEALVYFSILLVCLYLSARQHGFQILIHQQNLSPVCRNFPCLVRTLGQNLEPQSIFQSSSDHQLLESPCRAFLRSPCALQQEMVPSMSVEPSSPGHGQFFTSTHKNCTGMPKKTRE